MFWIYKHLFWESAKVFTNIFVPIRCNDTLLSLQIVISPMHALISTKEGDCNCPDCKGTIVIIWDLRALPILLSTSIFTCYINCLNKISWESGYDKMQLLRHIERNFQYYLLLLLLLQFSKIAFFWSIFFSSVCKSTHQKWICISYINVRLVSMY